MAAVSEEDTAVETLVVELEGLKVVSSGVGVLDIVGMNVVSGSVEVLKGDAVLVVDVEVSKAIVVPIEDFVKLPASHSSKALDSRLIVSSLELTGERKLGSYYACLVTGNINDDSYD